MSLDYVQNSRYSANMSESARVAKDLLRKSFSSGIDKTHVISRRSGKERFERIMEKMRRENSQSQQIKQMKNDLMRLYLTTGAHGALLIISPSFGVHKIATAGDFNSFLQTYASALTAQRKMTRRDVRYNIDDVWQRFQGSGGLAEIESFCSALHRAGCDVELVEHAKDAYLAAIGTHADTEEVRSSLAHHLNVGLQSFISAYSLE